MQQRKYLNHMFGIAALAMLFGTVSVHAQTAGSQTTDSQTTTGAQTSGGSSGAAGERATGTAQPGAAAPTADKDMAGKAAAGKDTGGKMLSKADQNMMREIAQANLAEIEAGKVALNQSKNDQVKSYAQRMIDDHMQAQKELEQLAQTKGVTLPTGPDNKHQAAIKKLSALEGDKFDKQYMAQGGISDHRNTHRLLERVQQRAGDPDLKALAAKMEPTVSQHLTMAQDLHSAKPPASGSTGPAGTGAAGTSGTSGEAGTPGTPAGTPGTSGTSGETGTPGTSGSSDSATPGKQ